MLHVKIATARNSLS